MDKEVLEVMNRAIETQHGVEVETNNTDTFRRLFYKLRRDARDIGDHSYDNLTCKTSPTNPRGSIWLIKKAADDGTELREDNNTT